MNTPDTRTSDYVCFDCGAPYLSHGIFMDYNEVVGGVTHHMGRCGICEEEKALTHVRHFNWLRKPKTHEQG